MNELPDTGKFINDAITLIRSCSLAPSAIIKRLRYIYLIAFGLSEPREINNGYCEEFAEDLAGLLPNAVTKWDDEMLDVPPELGWGSHKFVLWQNRYYDCEAPSGVNDWRHLPFFVRQRY